MIDTVARAEAYLEANAALDIEASQDEVPYDLEALHSLLSEAKGYDVALRLNRTPLARFFASQKDEKLYHKGVLTPEHIIRTKRFPAVFDKDYNGELDNYIKNYEAYFARHATNEIMLNPVPNWAVIRGIGTLAIGKNEKEAKIIEDITSHTMKAILQGEELGGYQSSSEADSFAMEYWELEQMKLKSQ
jgi:rhamnose utilization protein RhaD (predicted bifunctional aldolase and dehydrogenase)